MARVATEELTDSKLFTKRTLGMAQHANRLINYNDVIINIHDRQLFAGKINRIGHFNGDTINASDIKLRRKANFAVYCNVSSFNMFLPCTTR
ncbi:hypothetical protein D3C85_1445950 [compost metagenome]